MKNFWFIIKICVFFLVLFILPSAFANESINDIKENIKNLQNKQKQILENNDSMYFLWNLNNYIQDNLSSVEIVELSNIISSYNFSSNKLKNTSWDFWNLLKMKKDAYKKIFSYVSKDKINLYLEFVKTDIEIVYEYWEIEKNILKNEEILNEKLSDIKIKISKNKEEIQNNLNDLINDKINEKIDNIKNNENFKKLDLETKKYIIYNIIDYTEKRKEDRIKLNSWKSVNNIDVYAIVINRLNNFSLELK